MRGHENVIRMRLEGHAPRLLWLDDLAPVDPWHVQYERRDNPELADMRFVVGLNVQVCGADREAAIAWGKACEAAGAKRVVVAVQRQPEGKTYYETVEVIDSAGYMTWSADEPAHA